MKYIKVLILGIAIFRMNNVFAQYQNLMVGAEVGYGSSFLKGDVYFTQSSTAYLGSVFAQYQLNKNVAFRGGINYETKGAQDNFPITDINANYLGEGTVYSRYKYLVIPLLVRLSIGNKVKGFINAGPYMANLLRQTDVLTGNGFNNVNNDHTSSYKRFDLGITGGFGMGISIGKSWFLSMELRNNYGLTNINNVSPSSTSIKNTSIQAILGLGYKLQ